MTDQHPPNDGEEHRPSDPTDSSAPTEGAGPRIPAGEAPSVGKRFGDFEIIREIGRGGMGLVFEARQVSLNRQVALKLLPPGIGMTKDSVKRFEREAQTAAKLHHTNIVPVFAIGSEQGNYFYAMELVDGQSLGEILSSLRGGDSNPLMEATVTNVSGQMPRTKEQASATASQTTVSDTSGGGGRPWFDTVAKLIADVADALAYAHGRGVIHRDIKPANLMLSTDGRLCVMDFGLARVAEEPGMTVTGSFMGTPAYMSPEQIAAGRIKVDGRSDVYSLGAVLYEMLTYHRPFPGESRDEILTAIMTRDPMAPRKINPRVPTDLETICQKAMEKDPERRYQKAEDLAGDLRRFLNRGLITARRASPVRRAVKAMRRHPVIATAAIAAVVLIGGVGGVTKILSAQKATETALRGVADARYYLTQGQFAEGLEAVNKSLDLDPKLTDARILRGRLLIQLNRTPDAVAEAQKVIESDPNDWTAHLIMVMAAKDRDFNAQRQIDPRVHMKVVEEQAPESADAFYVRALVEESDAAALDLLNKAIDIQPGHVEALRERIYRLAELKDFPAALQDAERLAVISARSAKGRQLAGWIYDQQSDLEEAFAQYDRAIAIDPDDPITYRYRADSYASQGNHLQAYEDLSKAIELQPTYVPSLIQRGFLGMQLGKFEESVNDARRALDLRPETTIAYAVLYFSYRAQGRVDELDDLIGEAKASASAWAQPREKAGFLANLAEGYIESGRLDKAMAEADSAVLLAPDLPVGYAVRASVHRLMRNREAMEKDCDSCADIPLDDPEELMERAGMLEFACQRRDLSIRDLTRAIEIAPNWSALYDDRGHTYRRGRNHEAALADFDRAIELAPQGFAFYNNRAIVHARLDQNEEAIADYTKCIELGGDHYIVRNNRRQQYELVSRFDEARADIDRIAELTPESNRAQRYRGELYRRMGRLDDALSSYDAAIEADPGDVDSYLGRSLVLALMPGACDRAIAGLEKGRSLRPETDPGVSNRVGFIHAALIAQNCPDAFDARLALELGRQIVQRNPGGAGNHQVLGLALFRNGRNSEALEAIQRSVELNEGTPPAVTLFASAMIRGRLGQKSQARGDYDRGAERMRKTHPNDPMLQVLREEAAGILGISAPRSLVN